MRNLTFYLCVATLLCSCQQIAYTLYGIKQPKQKDKQEILKYLDSHDFSKRDNYALNFDGYIERSVKYDGSVNEVLFFNNKGELLTPTKSLENSCSGRVSGYITELGDSSLFIASDSILFLDYLSGLTNLDGNLIDLNLNPESHYYAVVTWATFTGRLNRANIQWENLLDSMNTKNKISIYRLNLDMQKFWGEDPQYTGKLGPDDFN